MDYLYFRFGEVPALPGCFSQGKTIEELKRNIAEAIEGWLEVEYGQGNREILISDYIS
jgi:predicted RNase H-like HicB family nuclease